MILNNFNHNNDCCICLKKLGHKNITITSCGHCFHLTCIVENLRQNVYNGKNCPLCRRSIYEKISFGHKKTPTVNVNTSINTRIPHQSGGIWGLPAHVPRSRIPIRRVSRPPPFQTLTERIQQRRFSLVAGAPDHSSRTPGIQNIQTKRRFIYKKYDKLKFQQLKDKLKEKNLSTRGYIRKTLINRLVDSEIN